jgi:SMODS-associating 2TM, beta-strand rich effector domain
VVSRGRVQLILSIAVVVWGGLLFAEGVHLTSRLLQPYSVAVGAVVLVLAGYNRWLWRWSWLRWLPGTPPVLHGTWRGTLTSNYIPPGGATQIPPIEVFLTVTQTASTLSIGLLTAESRSESLTCTLSPAPPGTWTAWLTYRNQPQLLLQDRSRMHHGSMELTVHGAPPEMLDGSYWTDRGTKGQVQFWARSPRKHSDFASAHADPALAGTTPARS